MHSKEVLPAIAILISRKRRESGFREGRRTYKNGGKNEG
jgi:hypothetical protein